MKIFNRKSQNKKKMRPLTKTEFILVSTLIFSVIIYGGYQYLLLPKWNTYEKTRSELKIAKAQCDALRSEYKDLKKIKEQKTNVKYQLSELGKALPPYISEEDIILTIGKYGKDNSISIKSVALDKANSSNPSNFISANEKSTESEQTQNNKDTSEVKGKTEGGIGPTVLTKFITVAFSGSVNHLYKFLEKFEKNDKKLAIKEMALNKDKEAIIGGTMRIQYIGYQDGKDGSKYDLDAPEVNGKTTPFDGMVSAVGKNAQSEVEANFSLVLNKSEEQSPKFIFGEYKKAETEIYNSTNGKINGKFTIEKGKGSEKFAYTYSLGNNTKTEKKNLEIINGKLVVLVESNPRVLKEDLMQITLDVENKTEYPLEISISNDDAQNPRFVLGKKQGNVYSK